jgi:predicted enzyme related to lactoylglutathione lyase
VFILAAVPEARAGKNRMHVDVHPKDAEAHLTRLQRLGGTLHGERVERYGIWWQVMCDPEGNEFCVVSGAQGPEVGDASSG